MLDFRCFLREFLLESLILKKMQKELLPKPGLGRLVVFTRHWGASPVREKYGKKYSYCQSVKLSVIGEEVHHRSNPRLLSLVI